MSITSQGIGIVATGQYAYKGVIASATPASSYQLGQKAFFTDVGTNGTEMSVSASSTWIPHNGQAMLYQLTIPVVKAPTIPADASATANGAITFGTAVNAAFSRCFCYFDANVVNATQPAGFLYMEMSNTTNAIVYNNYYTPGVGVFPTVPATKTPFAGAVPGGAGSTSEITAFTYKLNGGLLGLYGSLILQTLLECNSTATTKAMRHRIGATQTAIQSLTTQQTLHGSLSMKNVGSQSAQRWSGTFTNQTVASNTVTTTTDTSADSTCSLTFQTAGAATDWAAFSLCNISVAVS